MSTPTETETPLPCPFCGNDPYTGAVGGDDYSYFAVECWKCKGSEGTPFIGVHADCREDALAVWNNQALARENAQLREAVIAGEFRKDQIHRLEEENAQLRAANRELAARAEAYRQDNERLSRTAAEFDTARMVAEKQRDDLLAEMIAFRDIDMAAMRADFQEAADAQFRAWAQNRARAAIARCQPPEKGAS